MKMWTSSVVEWCVQPELVRLAMMPCGKGGEVRGVVELGQRGRGRMWGGGRAQS